MLFRILKNDLKRKKGINIILFLFIVMATIFLSSSINNMMVVKNATKYTMKKTKIPDLLITGYEPGKKEKIQEWLDKNKQLYKNYKYAENCIMERDAIKVFKKGSYKAIKSNNTVYIQNLPKDNVKVYERNGGKIDLKSGEVAVTTQQASAYDLKVGSKMQFKVNGIKKPFKVAYIVKEGIYVGSMSGMERFIFSDKDYNEMRKDKNILKRENYYINTNNVEKTRSAFENQKFGNGYMSTLDKGVVSMLYVMDLVMAGMLTVIGVCLIVIAVLVLRFTIVFTLEEDYREIGIMKAIGLKNFGIKSLYLIKYFILVASGAVLGCIISFPVSNIMTESVMKNMIAENTSNNTWLIMLCSISIVVFVMLLCYACMHKMNHLSAINSIKNAGTGKKSSRKSVLKLNHRKRGKVPFYLAFNDLLCNPKQYIALLLVFMMGIVLIIMPLNTLNTMASTEMSDQFLLDKKATAFIVNLMGTKGEHITSQKDLKKSVKRLKTRFAAKGYEVEMDAIPMFMGGISKKKNDNVTPLLMTKHLDKKHDNFTFSEGKAPKLENEIALSKKVLESEKLQVGDSIYVNVGQTSKKCVITGTYQDYMQLGRSARLNSVIDTDDVSLAGVWNIPVYVKNVAGKDDWIAKAKKDFPNYSFKTSFEVVSSNVGGILDNIDSMRVWLIALITLINMMITALMLRMFIIREKGEIAILLSMGFDQFAIRSRQIIRMALILVFATVLAILVSKIMDATVLKQIFGVMGAEVKIQVDVLTSYLLGPCILLVGIVLTAIVATRRVKKIDIREMADGE